MRSKCITMDHWWTPNRLPVPLCVARFHGFLVLAATIVVGDINQYIQNCHLTIGT